MSRLLDEAALGAGPEEREGAGPDRADRKSVV